MSMPKQHIALSKPARAFSDISIILVVSEITLAGFQAFGTINPSTATWFVLCVLSCTFATLRLCLLLHLWVPPQRRMIVALLETFVALVLIWGMYSYAARADSPIWAAFKTGVNSIERGDQFSLREPRLPAAENATPSAGHTSSEKNTPALFLIVIVAGSTVLVKIDSRLALKHSRRFPCLIALIAFINCAIVWQRTPDFLPRSLVDAESPSDVDRTSDVDRNPINTEIVAPNDVLPDQLPTDRAVAAPIAAVMLFAVVAVMCFWWFIPVLFSLPFLRLFLLECTNTTQLARIWIIATIVALFGFFVAISLGQTPLTRGMCIVLAGTMTVSTLGLFVIAPVLSDHPTAWIATHVVSIVQFLALGIGLVFIQNPDDWQDLSSLILPLVLAAATALHLLLGLYLPQKLKQLDHLNNAAFAISTLGGAALFVLVPELFRSVFPYLFWILVLSRLSPFQDSRTRQLETPRWIKTIRTLKLQVFDNLSRAAASPGPHPLVHRGNYIMNHSVDAALNPTLPPLGESVVVAGFDPPPVRSVLAILVAAISIGALALMWKIRIFWPTEPTDQAYWILMFVVPPAVSVILCLQIFLIMSRQVTLSATHVTLKRYWSVLWSVEIAALDECRIAASSRRRITLQTLTGQQFRLAPIRGEEFWPFASEIQARALEFVMTRVWLSLEREKAASFGPFTVSWDGISCGDKSIAWQDVAEIRIDSMYVSVIAVDNRKAWVSRRIHRVPNILALLSVHAHCRATWESVRRMVRDGQPVSHRLSDILSSVDSLRPYVTADPTSVDAMIFEMMKRDFALAAVQDVSDTKAFVDTLATIRPEVVDEIINQMGTGRARVKVESIAYRRLLSRVQFALQDNALSEKSTSNSPPSDQS